MGILNIKNPKTGQWEPVPYMTGPPGADGYTPVKGVDYYTLDEKAELEAYIATELAKRGQLAPEYASSIEECTDTTKLYVLPDGYIYAYIKHIDPGGKPLFTNLADPASDDWNSDSRTDSSGNIVSQTGAIVTNMFSANAGSVIRIKGLKDSGSSYLRIQGYSADGAKVGSGLYLTKLKSANNNGVAEYVSVTDDEYAYTLYRYTSSAGAEIAYPYAVSQIRVTGHLTGTESDVIVTLDQEIAYTTPSTGYAWANTGHAFVPAEYEDRIVELEGAVEVLKSGGAHSGARWFALGDSITQGWTSAVDSTADSGYKQYLNTNTAERWVNIVAAMNGYALTNHGVGGTGYLRKSDTTMNARELVDTIDFSQCDFVTLAYGVNDWKYAVNIGSLDDDIAAGGSMVANMRYVIQKILTDNPLCKIFVITPINCRSLGTYATNWGINYAGDAANNLGLEDIFELQKAVCEYHGIELIDMTHSSVVNRENIKSALADNVHPTVECHKAMARELARKISFV